MPETAAQTLARVQRELAEDRYLDTLVRSAYDSIFVLQPDGPSAASWGHRRLSRMFSIADATGNHPTGHVALMGRYQNFQSLLQEPDNAVRAERFVLFLQLYMISIRLRMEGNADATNAWSTTLNATAPGLGVDTYQAMNDEAIFDDLKRAAAAHCAATYRAAAATPAAAAAGSISLHTPKLPSMSKYVTSEAQVNRYLTL